ncbi:aspartic proteinase 36-like [Andrographis paniculata]|uniref:aspartic proteinase 36-like n=1 Tax=Andrographis paniculata TaxID=175694 RepID=UPI0021E779B1|nr:aspartic proteinase 36-like [Andrographis paniculata]
MPLTSFPAVVAAALLAAAAAVGAFGKSVTLTLERASHEGFELSRIRHLDRVRHGRFLQSNGVVEFPVGGTYNPSLVGLYYTKVKLGTPYKEFYVQIDTGSDVLWVNCNPCSGCPRSSGLKEITLEYFNPSDSSTASTISCSDKRCSLGGQYSESLCSGQNRCGFKFQYGDGSGASGYYVSDTVYLDSAVGNSASNSSTPIVFGCSTTLTGDLTRKEGAVDGIFGFGQNGLSVITQLSSQGITPKAFSHCLSGQNGGGGILVLGQAVDPSIVYTPLVKGQSHYNVNLQSISVNGQTLEISPSVFETSDNTGTIIDSGTTLAYFADGAYDPIITAVMQIVSPSTQTISSPNGDQCFFTTSSVSEVFPNISLNFAGGASMVLMPQDYLLEQHSRVGVSIWCIAIQKTEGQELTILGDLVLKDKIVVYDLSGERIGWANYDCSSSIEVSTSNSNTTQSVDAGKLDNENNSSRLRYGPYMLIHNIAMAFLLHIAFFGVYMFF